MGDAGRGRAEGAQGRMPATSRSSRHGDTAVVRTEGLAPNGNGWRSRPRRKPKEVLLDPRVRAHDWNMLNNRKRLGFLRPRALYRVADPDLYFHRYFSTRASPATGSTPRPPARRCGTTTRAASPSALRTPQPITSAGSSRTSPLVTASTGWGADDGVHDVDFWFRLRNPTMLRAPNVTQTLDVFQRRGPFRLPDQPGRRGAYDPLFPYAYGLTY